MLILLTLSIPFAALWIYLFKSHVNDLSNVRDSFQDSCVLPDSIVLWRRTVTVLGLLPAQRGIKKAILKWAAITRIFFALSDASKRTDCYPSRGNKDYGLNNKK